MFDAARAEALTVFITAVMYDVAIAQSKVTSQGQISVPALVRRKLGIGPGSVLEWEEQDGKVVIRRVGRFSSEDLHAAVFSIRPKPRSLAELKESVLRHIKGKRVRR